MVISADGTAVSVHTLQEGGAPELLLVHATGFHGPVWQPLVAALESPRRCLAPDLRGHGCSAPAPHQDYDWRGFAADVLAVVDQLRLERPFGIGHSSGATALLLAEEGRPGTFAALWCYEPILVAESSPKRRDRENWLAERTRRRRVRFATRAEALERFATRGTLAELHPDALHAYVDHGLEDLPGGGARLRCLPETEALVYEMGSANDCFTLLGAVGCPVTLVRGGQSEAVPQQLVEQAAARLPRARVEVHPDLGHLGPLQAPADMAASVRRALAAAAPGM